MAYIITGATGHIGNNLAKDLINHGKNVVILVRKIDESIANLNAKIVIGNLSDKSFLEKNIHEDDVVLHLAGVIDIKNNKPQETYQINYELTKTLFEVCEVKKIARFIYFSSVDCIYKKADEIINEPVAIFPDRFIDNYSHTKALATQYIFNARLSHPKMKINILYPSAVIGKNDFKPSYIGKVVKDIIAKKRQFGVKGGYNFVDVDDVVKATEIIIDKKIDGDFLLTGFPVTIYEFYNIVNRHLGRKRRIWKIPLFVARLSIPFVPYLSKFVLKTINENYNYDNHKLKNVLGLNLTNFDDTIEKTIKFFKEQEEK